MIIGRLIAFRGDKDYTDEPEILVEVTEVEGRRVELAFDGPGKGIRTYIAFDLGEMANAVLDYLTPEKK